MVLWRGETSDQRGGGRRWRRSSPGGAESEWVAHRDRFLFYFTWSCARWAEVMTRRVDSFLACLTVFR